MNEDNNNIIFLNPLSILVDIVRIKYPPTKGTIEIVSELYKKEGAYGLTDYYKNNDRAFIAIDSDLTIEKSVEVLAHELAHAIVGQTPDGEDSHNDKWNNKFDELLCYLESFYKAISSKNNGGE